MLRTIYYKKKIDNINISILSDDLVFVLGDYSKYDKTNKDILNLGIELCEAIIRGKEVKPKKMKMEEVLDYEKYKIIKDSSSELKKKGVEFNTLLQKAEEIKSLLANIKNGKKVKATKVKEIQSFFIAISTPFWKSNILSFQQRKISRGLHINE